jgi:hypothetical protein
MKPRIMRLERSEFRATCTKEIHERKKHKQMTIKRVYIQKRQAYAPL